MGKCSNSKQANRSAKLRLHLCYPTTPVPMWQQHSRRTSTFNSCVLNSYCFSFLSSNTKSSSNPVTKYAHATSSCICTLFHVTSSCTILWTASIPSYLSISISSKTLFYTLIIYTNAPSNTSQHLRNCDKGTRMRKISLYAASFFILLLLCVPVIISARHINRSRSRKSQILNFMPHYRSQVLRSLEMEITFLE